MQHVLNLPHLSFNNTGGVAGEKALAYMIVPHFSSVAETKGGAVINPSLSVKGGSSFHFLQISSSVSDTRK